MSTGFAAIRLTDSYVTSGKIKDYQYAFDPTGTQPGPEFFRQKKHPPPGGPVHRGYTSGTLWTGVTVINKSSQTKKFYIYGEAVFSLWLLFTRNISAGPTESWEPENRDSSETGSLPGSKNTSVVLLAPGEQKDILIGLGSATSLTNNLYYSDSPEFRSRHLTRSILLFLFYGFMLAFSFQALYLAWVLKRKSYFYFAGFNVCVTLCLSSSDGVLDFMVPAPWFGNWVQFIKLFQCFAWLFLLIFAYKVMGREQNNSLPQRICNFLAAVLTASALLTLSPFYNVVAYFIDTLTLVLILVITWFGIKDWKTDIPLLNL